MDRFLRYNPLELNRLVALQGLPPTTVGESQLQMVNIVHEKFMSCVVSNGHDRIVEGIRICVLFQGLACIGFDVAVNSHFCIH